MQRITLLLTAILLSISGFSQAVVRGYVTDQKGEPLPFASIYIKGTTKGTTSNSEGAYTIELAPGSYYIVYQYIGFKSHVESVVLPPDGVIKNISLTEDVLELGEVEVKADREDPAYAIIRKAQEKRTFYRDQIGSYQCDAYIKGYFKLTETPEKIFGQEIGDMDGVLDSAGQGYVYLSESVSNIYFKEPDQKKEVMISSKVSGDPQGFSFNQASGMDFDFYENVVRFSRALVSPIASNAMDYYRYRLEGVVFDLEGRMINRIAVIPKNEQAAVFEGTIYITEDLWNIHDVDLYVTGKSLKQPLIDTMWIKQLFVPVDRTEDQVWSLFNQQVRVKIGLLGFYSIGEFSAVFSNYIFDPEFPEEVFNENMLEVREGANERDSNYWQSIRPIPLTKAEIKDYVKKDSLRQIWESPKYLDSIDREENKFSFFNIFSSYTYQNSRKGTRFTVSSPILKIGFNPVQGFNSSMSVSWNKELGENDDRQLGVRSSFNYGLKERILNPDISLSYNWDRLYNQKLNLRWRRAIVDYDASIPIWPVAAEFLNLYSKKNYRKIYRLQELSLNYKREIGRGMYLDLSSSYSNRSSVANKTNYSFKKRDDIYPENFPLELPLELLSTEEQLINTIEFRWRPGMRYWKFPDRRIPMGSKYPLFRIRYDIAVPVSDGGAEWQKLLFSVRKGGIGLGNVGYLDAIANLNLFISDKTVLWPDLFHFNGNEVMWVDGGKYMRGFLNMPYYTYSTTAANYTFFTEHHFDGFILDRVPLIRKLGWKSILGYSRMQREGGFNWNEAIFGIENIGIGPYRGGRINFVGSWGRGVPFDFGFRFSLINLIGIQL